MKIEIAFWGCQPGITNFALYSPNRSSPISAIIHSGFETRAHYIFSLFTHGYPDGHKRLLEIFWLITHLHYHGLGITDDVNPSEGFTTEIRGAEPLDSLYLRRTCGRTLSSLCRRGTWPNGAPRGQSWRATSSTRSRQTRRCGSDGTQPRLHLCSWRQSLKEILISNRPFPAL